MPVCTIRTLPAEEKQSQLSEQVFHFRRELAGTMSPYYAVGKAHTTSPRTVASSEHQDPWRRPLLRRVTRFAPVLQTPTLQQTPSHSEAQKIKGPVAAAVLTLGKPNAHFTQTSQSGAMTL